MKLLAVDIETSPNLADVWSLWKQNVSLNQLRESSQMLCFAAQFEGQPVEFYSEWDDGPVGMAAAAHRLLSESDAVIHYNGQTFDIPHINREMWQAGFKPPSPYKQIDLLKQIRKAFSFPSYKLAYVAPAFGVGAKVEHEGHELWVKVMAGDQDARDRMRAYNIRDTELLHPLYQAVRPWIATPSEAAFQGGDEDRCTAAGCGSTDLRKEGYAFLLSGKYQRYCCRVCGTWSRGTKRVDGAELVRVA